MRAAVDSVCGIGACAGVISGGDSGCVEGGRGEKKSGSSLA